jgi:hypothetical protein
MRQQSEYFLRDEGPRRWAWWFGVPFLALGLLAWLLREDRLVPLVMLLFGATGVALAIDGIRTGIVEVKVGTYSRLQQPISFWLHVLFFLFLGVASIVAVGVRLRG